MGGLGPSGLTDNAEVYPMLGVVVSGSSITVCN